MRGITLICSMYMFLNKIQHSWEHSRQWFYREVEWFFWRVLGYFFFKKKFFTDHKMRGFHFHVDTVSKNLCVIKKIIKNLSQKLIFRFITIKFTSRRKYFYFVSKFEKLLSSECIVTCSDGTNPKFQNFKLA